MLHNRIDFAQLINQLLNIPTQIKPVSTIDLKLSTITTTTSNIVDFHQYQLLIIIDSLIFNLYGRSKKRDRFRLNNSFFNSSQSVMSMSQMSDIMSQANHSILGNNINGDGELKVVMGYVQSLVMSQGFYKKLKVFYERQGGNKQRNHHYLQNLFETLQYICSKQRLPIKQHLIKQRNTYFKSFLSNSTLITFIPTNNQQILQLINSVLFTNQLDKILTLISSTDNNNIIQQKQQQRLLFSINRVYFVAKRTQTRKHFRNIKYTADDMLFNLARLYMRSFSTKLSTLQQSRHPIFLLLKNYLISFYLPIFKKFTDLVQQLTKYCHSGMIVFYQQNQQMLEKVVGQFIDEWPLELVEFLSMLSKLVEGTGGIGVTGSQGMMGYNGKMESRQSSKGGTPTNRQQQQEQERHISSMVPVKRFLIYSFFCDTELIKQHVFPEVNNTNINTNKSQNNKSNTQKSTITLQQYQQVCNYIINLFFTSSVKKYSTYYTAQQLVPLTQLSTAIERRLQQRLSLYNCLQGREFYYDQDSPLSSLMDNYFIQQPILNYDYFILQQAISRIQFTPKDNKRYQIISYSTVMVGNNITTNPNNIFQNNNYNSSSNQMFLKDKQSLSNQILMKNASGGNNNYGNNEMFIRGIRRELTLSPINNNGGNNNRLGLFMAQNEELHHKFSLVEERESLHGSTMAFNTNSNQHGGYSNSHKVYLTTPVFDMHGVEEQQLFLPTNNNLHELDLLTWMTVGGCHNYKQKVSARKVRLSKTLSIQHKPHSIQKRKTIDVNKSPRTLNLENIKLNRVIDDNQNYYENLLHTHGRSNSYGGEEKENQILWKRESIKEVLNQHINNIRKQKLQFKSFNKDKVRQINRLYQEYASKNVNV